MRKLTFLVSILLLMGGAAFGQNTKATPAPAAANNAAKAPKGAMTGSFDGTIDGDKVTGNVTITYPNSGAGSNSSRTRKYKGKKRRTGSASAKPASNVYLRLNSEDRKLLESIRDNTKPATNGPAIKRLQFDQNTVELQRNNWRYIVGTATLADDSKATNLNGLVRVESSKNVDAEVTDNGSIAILGIEPGAGRVSIYDARTGKTLGTIHTNMPEPPATPAAWSWNDYFHPWFEIIVVILLILILVAAWRIAPILQAFYDDLVEDREARERRHQERLDAFNRARQAATVPTAAAAPSPTKEKEAGQEELEPAAAAQPGEHEPGQTTQTGEEDEEEEGRATVMARETPLETAPGTPFSEPAAEPEQVEPTPASISAEIADRQEGTKNTADNAGGTGSDETSSETSKNVQ